MVRFGLIDSSNMAEAVERLRIIKREAPLVTDYLNYRMLTATPDQFQSLLEAADSLQMKIWGVFKDIGREAPIASGKLFLEWVANMAVPLEARTKEEFIVKFLSRFASHPAYGGTYVADEPEQHLAESLRFSHLVRECDSKHPRLADTGVERGMDLRAFATEAEILCRHAYPFGRDASWLARFRESSLDPAAAVGTIAQDTQLIADKYKKESAIILQAHHFGQIQSPEYQRMARENKANFPSADDMKRMVQFALAQMNPSLVLFFAYHYVHDPRLLQTVTAPDDRNPWQNLCRVLSCD